MPPPDLPPIVDALQAGLENIVEIAADLSLGPKTQAYDPEAAARAAAHPISTDLSVPDIVVQGTKMTKVSTQQKKVLFRIDPDEGKILYESRKGGCIPIENIKEIRTGINARYHRAQYGFSEEAENRWITLIYVLDGEYKTLHILADTKEVFTAWETAITKLHSIRQGLMKGLGQTETRQAVWERQYYKAADKNGDQKLDVEDVEDLCKRLNINIKTEELRKLFVKADTAGQGHLDIEGFRGIMRALKRRPEIDGLYSRACAQHQGKFNFTAFFYFMRETQKSAHTEEELKEMFLRQTAQQPPGPNTSKEILGLDGFYNFLQSPDNAAFTDAHGKTWQDMTQPISQYYISSSHNTYLVGHQLVGVSTVEGYIRALLLGCRSVELDVYDGDGEPDIYHGKTLTSKVSLRDVCHAINKYAFIASPYPLIISAEVHCSVAQQEKLVKIMQEEFGDKLVSAPVENRPKLESLPSPEELKGKILLKAKNLFLLAEIAGKAKTEQLDLEAMFTSTSESESDNDKKGLVGGLKAKWRKARGKEPSDSSHPEKPKVKMSFSLLALLVYTVGVKCRGLGANIEYAPEHIFSLSENSAGRLIKRESSMMDLVRHSRKNLVRIYPKGIRVNSTNYHPHKFWAAGSQVVAINWQTIDTGFIMNHAMFKRNGACGYVLKPLPLRLGEDITKTRTRHFLDVTVISAQQLPRPRSNGQEIVDKTIVDPFVEISIHTPEWLAHPFRKADELHSSALSGKTKHVMDNGFNPIWEQELNMNWEQLGGKEMRDCVFVKFTVKQKGKEGADDEPLGIYCASLGTLNLGYRHLPLYNAQMSQHMFSTLFVHLSIRDVVMRTDLPPPPTKKNSAA